jgi:predicted membrane protein
MAKKIMSSKKAQSLSFALFLIGLAIIALLKAWWPGIMLVVGLPLAFRQYLLGKHYDMAVTLFVFLGVFFTVQFNISWEILLPVLFTVGAIYIFFREFVQGSKKDEAEEEEELNKEIEEEQEDKSKK